MEEAPSVGTSYAHGPGRPMEPPKLSADGVTEKALAHGDEDVIKFADTALAVGDDGALAAAQRAIELSVPLG